MRYYILALFVLFSTLNFSQTIKEFNLVSEMDGTITLDNGETVSFWGYGLIKPSGAYQSFLPAPTLEINKGDSVVINLFNVSPEGHTIHLHGLDVNQSNDGVPSTSFTIGINDSAAYSFNATHEGTFLYHCHVLTMLHLTMGMYGMIVVNNYPDSSSIFENGPTFTNEYRFLTSDMDKSWNGSPIASLPEDIYFKSNYFMVNGKSGGQLYNDNSQNVKSYVGDTTVLRLGNIAYCKTRYIFPSELNAKAYMSDGRILPVAFDCDTLIINPGERYTVILTPDENVNQDIEVEYYEARNNNLEHINLIKLNGDASITEGEVGEFDIYPNPANDELTFRTVQLGGMIEIFDLSGKLIHEQIANHIVTKINVSQFNDGIYILKYQDKTLKLVKQ